MKPKQDEAQRPPILPWAELIAGDLTAAERKEAIKVLFEERQKPMSLSEEIVFFSCAQMAMMRLLSDVLEQQARLARARETMPFASEEREGEGRPLPH